MAGQGPAMDGRGQHVFKKNPSRSVPPMAGRVLPGHGQRDAQVASQVTARKDPLSWNPHPPSPLNRLFATSGNWRSLNRAQTTDIASRTRTTTE